MSWRTPMILLGAGILLAGCPSGDDDDDVADDDSAGDDDVSDDDTGDDDTGGETGCGGLAPPGYAGANGYHFVLDDGSDIVVDNEPYEHTISDVSSGLSISVDNTTPPGSIPDEGTDYIWTTFTAAPFSLVVAGEQPLQFDHQNGARLTLNIVPEYPTGIMRTYAIHQSFPSSWGTATCSQTAAQSQPLQCTYEAVLVYTAQDEVTGATYVAGCTAISGAFDTVMQPAS